MNRVNTNINHEFESQIFEVKQTERHAIARELHDEMSQYLSSIHFHASSILRVAEMQSVINDAMAIDKITSHIFDMMHKQISNLRMKEFDNVQNNFAEIILSKVKEWQNKNPDIVTDIAINGPFSDIDTNTLFTLYRLVQESLTNIQRHSNANNVAVTVERIEKFIALKISDDGYGCDLNNSTEGFGLLGMKERVVECKGLFKTVSSQGNGFAIYVLLPCNIPTGAREK